MCHVLVASITNKIWETVISKEFDMQSKQYIIPALVLALGLAACNGSSTSGPGYQKLSRNMTEIIRNDMAEKNITGLSIGVVDDQQLVWARGFGMADMPGNIPATRETLYPVASVTKVFTATAMMRLAEESQLDIDHSYVTYVPEFSLNTRFGPIEDITFRNMLTHHSGLPTDFLHHDPLPADVQPNSAAYLADISEDYQAFPANAINSYSNVAFALLSIAIAEVSNTTYPLYIKQSLLDPMNMDDSYVTHQVGDSNTAIGHMQGEAIAEYTFRTVGDGGLVSNVIDLANFMITLNNDGVADGTQVISKASIDTMFSVQNAEVPLDLGSQTGLAWGIYPDILGANHLVVGHNGRVAGFTSTLLYSPSAKLGVVILSNEDTANVDELAKQTMQLAYQEKYQQAVEIAPTTPEPIPGIYSDDLFGLYYSGIAGPVLVDHDGVNYILSNLEKDYTLIRTDEGKYQISAANPEDDLNGLLLTLTEVQGYQVLVAETNDEEYARFLFAQQLPEVDLPEIWSDRLGEYHITDDHDRENGQSTPATITEQEGVLLFSFDELYILIPIDDNHAYIAGLGRGLGQTISFREEQGLSFLTFSGIDFLKE
jgi:CubicO group peptidase (beta-lactamase class C family)